VWRSGQKQPVLELWRQIPDRPGDLRVDRIFLTARRRGVMRLIEDKQRTGSKVTQRISETGAVSRIDQQSMRNQKTARGQPWINRESALPPYRGDTGAVDDCEPQPEPRLKLIRPLPEHRGRRGNDDKVDPTPQQQFAQDEAGFDRFAEADIIGDQQIDPRKYERFAQRFELIRVEADARPERCLKTGWGRLPLHSPTVPCVHTPQTTRDRRTAARRRAASRHPR
jgi:hypothetical protein